MIKRRAVLILTTLLAIGALVGGYLWMFERKPPAPDRPSSVPAGATWVGWNKGEWIDCTALPQPGRFRCEVFADVTGDRISSGEYALARSGSGETSPAKLIAFDGQAIETSAGKLVPYGSHTYFGGGTGNWAKDFGPPP